MTRDDFTAVYLYDFTTVRLELNFPFQGGKSDMTADEYSMYVWIVYGCFLIGNLLGRYGIQWGQIDRRGPCSLITYLE